MPETKSWWETLGGILTGVAALIVAITGLLTLIGSRHSNDIRIYEVEETIKYPAANCKSAATATVVGLGGQVIDTGDTWVNFKLKDQAISVFCKVEHNSLAVVSGRDQADNGNLAKRLKDEILTGH